MSTTFKNNRGQSIDHFINDCISNRIYEYGIEEQQQGKTTTTSLDSSPVVIATYVERLMRRILVFPEK